MLRFIDPVQEIAKLAAMPAPNVAPNKPVEPAPNSEPAPNMAPNMAPNSEQARNARGRVPEAERAYQRELMRKRRAKPESVQ